MAAFAYSAINALGAESAGQITAPDAGSARELLRQKGLRPVSLSEVGATGSAEKKRKRIKPRSLQVFSRQFATMIDAGLSIVQSLVILEEQSDDKALAGVIREVRSDVEGGMLLSQAMARHPKVFDRLYISMVEAGDLPFLTKIVVTASDLVRGYWFILFPLMGGSVYGFRRWKRKPAGRQVWDRFKLRAPAGIGKVVLKVTMARFSRTLATLVAAGVDIIKALEISGQPAGNWVVESAGAEA